MRLFIALTLTAVLTLLAPAGAAADDDDDDDDDGCRPLVIADRPGATNAPSTVHAGCIQLATGAEVAVSSAETRVTLPVLLRWGVLPRTELRLGLSPVTIRSVDTTGTELDGPVASVGGKLSIFTGRVALGLLAQVDAPVSTEIVDGAVAGTRILVESAVDSTTLAVNVGVDAVPTATGHEPAIAWAVGASYELVAERVAAAADTSALAVLGPDKSYRQAVGASLAVRIAPTMQLDASIDVDIVADARAVRFAIGVVTRL